DGAKILQSGELTSPVLLFVNGRTQTTRGYGQMFTLTDMDTVGLHWSCESIGEEQEGDNQRLRMRLREGDWSVEIRYTLRAGSARVERGIRIEYHGKGEARLRWFE